MGRPKGIPKTGGRQTGTPNKVKLNVADILAASNYNSVEALLKVMPNLAPHQVAQVNLALLPYQFGKPKESEGTNEDQGVNPADSETTDELVKALSATNEANNRSKDS